MKTKRAIALFRKFFPATMKAMGGVQGLTRWLVTEDPMPVRVARVFRTENKRLLREAEQLNRVGKSDLFSVILGSLPSVA